MEPNTRNFVTIIGGQHGDEPTGARICHGLYPMRSTELIIIPCINPLGFKAKTRECQGIDLNRSYDGEIESLVVAKSITLIKTLCQLSRLVIDVHSTHAFMLDQPVFLVNDFADGYRQCFDIAEFQSEAPVGSLRWYCNKISTPMITYEAVEFDPIDDKQIQTGIDEILKVLGHAGIN